MSLRLALAIAVAVSVALVGWSSYRSTGRAKRISAPTPRTTDEPIERKDNPPDAPGRDLRARIHVMSPTGSDIPNARVSLARIGRTARPVSATTDLHGIAEIAIADPGVHLIRATADGWCEKQAYARMPGETTIALAKGARLWIQPEATTDWDGIRILVANRIGASREFATGDIRIDTGIWEAGAVDVYARMRDGEPARLGTVAIPEVGTVVFPAGLPQRRGLLVRVMAPARATTVQRWIASWVRRRAPPQELDRTPSTEHGLYRIDLPQRANLLRIDAPGYPRLFWTVPKRPDGSHEILLEAIGRLQIDLGRALAEGSVRVYLLHSAPTGTGARPVTFSPWMPPHEAGRDPADRSTINLAACTPSYTAGAAIARRECAGEQVVEVGPLPARATVAVQAIDRQGRRSRFQVVTVKKGLTRVELQWAPTTDLHVRLLGEDSGGLGGAMVDLETKDYLGNTTAFGRAFSGASGELTARNIETALVCELTVWWQDHVRRYQFAPGSLEPDNAMRTLRWRMPDTRLARATVTSGEGFLPSLWVNFNVVNGGSVAALTDEHGVAAARVPKGERIIVVARRPVDGLVLTKELKEDGTVTLRMPSGRVGVEITLRLSRQPTDVLLELRDKGRTRKRENVFVDGTGVVRLTGVKPGDYVLRISAGKTQLERPLRVVPGQLTSTDVDLR